MSKFLEEEARERTRGLLRTNSETYRHLGEQEIGDEQAFVKPPFFIMWCPPHGHVIASPSVEEAQSAAANFAGGHPGTVAAVYQLVGYAYIPRRPAPFLAAPLSEDGAGDNDGDERARA